MRERNLEFDEQQQQRERAPRRQARDGIGKGKRRIEAVRAEERQDAALEKEKADAREIAADDAVGHVTQIAGQRKAADHV